MSDFPRVYDEARLSKVKVIRTVYDTENDKVLKREEFSFLRLQEALEEIRRMFESDKTMFEVLKRRTGNALICTHEEVVDNKYSYSMVLTGYKKMRRIEVGLDDPHKYANEAFCIEAGDSVKEQ